MKLQLKAREALYFLCEETCVILYWIGIWSLLQLTPLLMSAPFCLACFFLGGLGLFCVKVAASATLLHNIAHTTRHVRQLPHAQNWARKPRA